MLSICQLHLQLTFDDCPTVAAACSRRRHSTVCDTIDVCCSDSGTVVVVCVFVQLLTVMTRGINVSYSFP